MSIKEKKVWTKILEAYKSFAHLWDKKNSNYGDKRMRQDSFLNLLEIYRELDDEATVDILKSKLNNMRTSFFRELKKVKYGLQSGSGSNDSYVPTLWYFDLLMFLDETNELTQSSLDILDRESSIKKFIEDASTTSYETEPFQVKKKQRRSNSVIQKKEEELLDTENQLLLLKEDKWEILSKYITVQLQEIDNDQLDIVNKIISDAIFFGKKRKLTVNSHIVLDIQNNEHGR